MIFMSEIENFTIHGKEANNRRDTPDEFQSAIFISNYLNLCLVSEYFALHMIEIFKKFSEIVSNLNDCH